MFFRTDLVRPAVAVAAFALAGCCSAPEEPAAPGLTEFTNHAAVWPDNNGTHISAHGGCMLKVGDT